MQDNISTLRSIINENQGILSIVLFTISIFIGWISGIFSSIRRRPKFKIECIPGPTLVCTYGTGNPHNGHDIHRTGIVIYLKISNIGSAASSIESVALGYRWHIQPLRWLWWRYGIRRFWLRHQTTALQDFRVEIGDQIKLYPFLFQRGSIPSAPPDTYLGIGQSTNGIVYFEQSDSWGACFPTSRKRATKIKICVVDTFGGHHFQSVSVPRVPLDEARKFNPSFGLTIDKINDNIGVFDLPADDDGNPILKR